MSIFKDTYIKWSFIISLVLLAVGFALAYNAFKSNVHLLVVHFDAYRGIDFLGDKFDVFGILFSGLAINIINAVISVFLYRRERFLSHLFAFGSAFFSLLILIAVTVIISIN